MTTPRATLVGLVLAGALIGTGLFFGLRQRDWAPAGSPRHTTPASRPTDAAPEHHATPDQVSRSVSTALQKHRPALLKACWAPSTDSRARAHYTLNLTFDARGQQITRGLTEDRHNAPSDMARCLTQALPAITVPPPGRTISVEVPLQVP